MSNFFKLRCKTHSLSTYYEARVERIVDEMLATLKNKIVHNEPQKSLIRVIDLLQQQIHPTIPEERSSGCQI